MSHINLKNLVTNTKNVNRQNIKPILNFMNPKAGHN